MEEKICAYLKKNYGKWYTNKELAEVFKTSPQKMARATKRLWESNGHIRERQYDWRVTPEVKRKLYKYRDRTRQEQMDILTNMAQAYYGDAKLVSSSAKEDPLIDEEIEGVEINLGGPIPRLTDKDLESCGCITEEEKAFGLIKNAKTLYLRFIFTKEKEAIFKLEKLLNAGIKFHSILNERPEKDEQINPIEISFGKMQEDVENEVFKLKKC